MGLSCSTKHCLRVTVLVAALTSILSCVHEPKPSEQKRTVASAETFDSAAYLFAAYKTSPADLSFAELQNILKTKRFSRIEDVLTEIKRVKPEYMKHFTLMHHSRSLHGASFENPRAIVFGRNGNFIITFNGAPDQANYSALEVTEFNQQTKKFEYREIDFKEDRTMDLPYKISPIGGTNGRCLACHGDNRPIWDAYRSWPGAFGSVDDIGPGDAVTGADDDHAVASFLGDQFPQIAHQQWDDVKSKVLTHGRYRLLGPMTHSRSTEILNSTLLTEEEPEDAKVLLPNSDLGDALGIHNAERIGEILKQKLAHSPLKYAYLYAVSGCDGTKASKAVESYLDLFDKNELGLIIQNDVLKKQLVARDFGIDWTISRDDARSFASPNKKAGDDYGTATNADEFWAMALKYQSAGMIMDEPGQLDNGGQIITMTKKFFPDVHVENWPMQLRPGVYVFISSSLANEMILRHVILAQVFADEPEFAHHLASQRLRLPDRLCQDIEKKIPAEFYSP